MITADKEQRMKSEINELRLGIKEKRTECEVLSSENLQLKNRQQLQLDELRNEFENKINIERENNINQIRGKQSSAIYVIFEYRVLDKAVRQDEVLKESEINAKNKIRKLESRINDLQRLNDEYQHQRV